MEKEIKDLNEQLSDYKFLRDKAKIKISSLEKQLKEVIKQNEELETCMKDIKLKYESRTQKAELREEKEQKRADKNEIRAEKAEERLREAEKMIREELETRPERYKQLLLEGGRYFTNKL